MYLKVYEGNQIEFCALKNMTSMSLVYSIPGLEKRGCPVVQDK